MVNEFGMNIVEFDGCALGLTSKEGTPIRKPWRIATTSKLMFDAFSSLKCPGHSSHAPCAGDETKRTESYTDEMAKLIHQAVSGEATTFSTAMPASETTDAKPNVHRPRIPTFDSAGMWNAMITKTLSYSDPMTRSPEAKAALDSELNDLRSNGVWDEDNVIEFEEAKRLHADAHFARVFPIYGIKHFEEVDSAKHKWKARVVLSGDQIKTSSGEWAAFNDLGAVPSSMTAARVAMALYALSPKATIVQSDCIRAYVQADMTGPPTYIRLPKAFWPASWHGKYRDPVVLLKKALYGHPKAGDIWADKLSKELDRLDYQTDEAWPGVYFKNVGTPDVIVIITYVDDLLFVGDTDKINSEMEYVRANIKMELPVTITKYLGVHHHVERTSTGTSFEFDMRDYLISAVKAFEETQGVNVKTSPTPYVPAAPQHNFEQMMSTPGVYKDIAATYVMKLMYAARMSAPNILTAVTKLSRELSKWTRDSDRKLIRILSYIKASSDQVLTGSLNFEDSDSLRLMAWPDADLCGDEMSTRSTSGFFLELAGKDGRGMPLSWGSKRQNFTASHTAEAELVSLSSVVRNEVLPVQHLLQLLMGKPINVFLMEDNAACIAACFKGYSPSLRYLKRTQRTAIGVIHDLLNSEPPEGCGRVELHKAATKDQKGDLFTKDMARPEFERSLELIRWRTTRLSRR